ncbi:hypothetical protein FJZ31_08045 [Candidatus Poribacteria bacterium]|nr:hypothetical protein [Candidatus Poribacteria bacterium]
MLNIDTIDLIDGSLRSKLLSLRTCGQDNICCPRASIKSVVSSFGLSIGDWRLMIEKQLKNKRFFNQQSTINNQQSLSIKLGFWL